MTAMFNHTNGSFMPNINPSIKQKNSLSKQHQQRGFTLVELLVAMTISLFLLAAIGLVYMTSKTSFTYANNTVRMSEDASLAIESLSRDIRMAAYGGCAGTTIARSPGVDNILFTADDPLDDPTLNPLPVVPGVVKSRPFLFRVTGLTDTYDAPNPFSTKQLYADTAVLGYTGTGTASDTARTAINAPTSSLTISTTAPILFVSGGSDRALQVSVAPVSGATTISFSGDPLKWFKSSASAPFPFMLISDCNGSELFRMNTMTSAGLMTIENPLLNTYGADAIVTPLVSSTYFLAKRKNGTVSANTSSLYRRYFNGSAATVEELISNIEDINYQYGVNTQLNTVGPNIGEPTFQTDAYRTADLVTDWERVVSIRIGFILVSDDTNMTPNADNTVAWNGGTYTPPNTTDRRLRRAYSTTVSVRNRMGV